jgi:hypothetical protein
MGSRLRRVAGLLLLAYGLAGLVLAGGTAIAVPAAGDVAARVAQAVESDRSAVIGTLASVEATLASLERSAGDLSGSVQDTISTVRGAAALARSVAVKMNDLEAATGVSILGATPLRDVGAGLGAIAESATTLADDLDRIAVDLAINTADVDGVREALGRTKPLVEDLRAAIAATSTGDAQGFGATLRLTGVALAGWLGFQAIGCVAF